jgi:hypothetical protein
VDPDNMFQMRLFHLDQYFIIFSAFMFLKSKGINLYGRSHLSEKEKRRRSEKVSKEANNY